MKQFLHFFLILLCINVYVYKASCSETYYIDDNSVVFYKIINWWYYSLPEESERFCGRPAKCLNQGNAQVEYIEMEKKLILHIKGGFADLFSIFKECEQCVGPSHLNCIRLNKKYFGDAKAAMMSPKSTPLNQFVFEGIKKNHAQYLKKIEKNISFVMEGVILGLVNGKVALHQSGNFIKECPKDSQNQESDFPIILNIIDTETDEIIATYSANQS